MGRVVFGFVHRRLRVDMVECHTTRVPVDSESIFEAEVYVMFSYLYLQVRYLVDSGIDSYSKHRASSLLSLGGKPKWRA
jgi:hypothetical protein